MRKAIFFDIDGTIVNTFNGEKKMSEAVRKAIRDLQAAGHYVFIATGRPYAFISKMLWDFGFDGFILSNGAQVVIKDQIVFADTMDQSFIKDITKQFDQHQVQYVLEGGHDSYILEDYREVFDFCMELEISDQFIKRQFNVEDIEVYKIEVLCKDKEIEEHCIKAVEEYPEYGYYYSISGEFFEIYTKKNNKARGIEKALEHLGIAIEDSYAFGDGMNDIEMLQEVGCGFAMGNASEEVKAYADQIVDTIDNEGVAKAIYQYILSDVKCSVCDKEVHEKICS